MELCELKDLIKESDPKDFCTDFLFDDSMWLFESEIGAPFNGNYQSFREIISSELGIHSENVSLVGSSKYGYSLSPKPEKYFRPFNEDSDLDVVIVDDELFVTTWEAFREAYYNGYTWIKGRHQSDVFRRFVVLLAEERYNTSYLRNIARMLDQMAVQVGLRTGISRSLKYRIYADWDAALSYHAFGIETLQRKLENDT
ncbi:MULTISPECIES: hypothetical protein [unclassified Roseibium]|uniref:hypothetical protein n=1 Tax=unclassified Roseibium TaxID=2629323 RepID=UPI00273D5900|nr:MULTISPECIES: hypothetical protein [unclassified Roseibium]